jgi:hypothetical protein
VVLINTFRSGKLILAQRRLLVHDGDASHGAMTRLIKGARFGLYALRARCDDD